MFSKFSLFPPIFTSSLMKSHQSNRSGPREGFACPELFVEIMKCVFSAETCHGSTEPALCHPWGMDWENHRWKTARRNQLGVTLPGLPAGLCSSLSPPFSSGDILCALFSFSVCQQSQAWALHPALPIWVQLCSIHGPFPSFPRDSCPSGSHDFTPLLFLAVPGLTLPWAAGGAQGIHQPSPLRGCHCCSGQGHPHPNSSPGCPQGWKHPSAPALHEPPAPIMPG